MDERDGMVAAIDARAAAVRQMLKALALLDANGPSLAAATLSLAIEQAGGRAPVLRDCETDAADLTVSWVH